MNLCLKYPIIFWNCACLITDTGGADTEKEPEEIEVVNIYEKEDFENYEYIDAPDRKTKIKKKKNRSADYGKVATAIGRMTMSGIKIVPPDINKSNYTFNPDVENNQILFGLKGLSNVGEEVVREIIKNRPYSSIKDFYIRVKPKHQVMESLIKCGAFDSMEDRRFAMAWYLWETCNKKSNLTLQNMTALKKYDLLPKDTEEQIYALKIYEFNRYLKNVCKKLPEYYSLDERALSFLLNNDYDDMIEANNYLSIKDWDKKVYQKWMNVIREWIASDKQGILDRLNTCIFKEEWKKYAEGTISSWEMSSMCYYYHEHELSRIDNNKYKFADFNELPDVPEIEKTFKKGDKTIKMYKLSKICGTCIDKNKSKSTVTLLTPSGAVVTVKFAKNYFALFDKRISEKQADGTKKIKEYSWFDRGSMIIVNGIKLEGQFISKKYASTEGHQLYKIDKIESNGELILRSERYMGDEE